MNKIAIITATEQELTAVRNEFKNMIEHKLSDLTYYEGKLDNKEYIVVKSGIGKVNAARTTQMIIDAFEIEYIINVGVAGSLNDKLEIGDIVIGEDLVQHDFDTTAFGDEKGYITGVGKIFKSDDKLIKIYKKYIQENKKNYNITVGVIASGDIFCTDINMKNKIHTKFNAECVEMEGAAIAQVCTLNKVPFIVIRSISDKPNGKNSMDYNEFVDMAAIRIAKILYNCAKYGQK